MIRAPIPVHFRTLHGRSRTAASPPHTDNTDDTGRPSLGTRRGTEFVLLLGMLENYLKVALRNLRRSAGHAAVSILGLAVGLAAFLLISLLVVDELSFDAFHSKADQIYRVVETRSSAEMIDTQIGLTAGMLVEAAENEIPEVVNSVRLLGPYAAGRRTVEHGDRRFYESEYFIAEGSVFEVFDFPLLRGNPDVALSEPNSVVLTESGAAKYFGASDPMGQTVGFERIGDLKVTGIAADPPGNSHLRFNMLVSYSTMNQNERWIEWMERFDNGSFVGYVELARGADDAVVSQKMDALLSSRRDETDVVRTPLLQPLADIHFGSAAIEHEHNEGESDGAYVSILMAIAVFLVVVGAINYMNMSTARSMRRAREIGLRKAVGGHRSQLVGQFLTESVVAALLAVMLAVAATSMLLPAFASFVGRELMMATVLTPGFLSGIVLVTLIVGLLAGSYPAVYLARFKPSEVLSGSKDTSRGAARLRRVLVVTQFSVSIVMIVATTVAYDQLEYISERNLGFDRDRLVVIDINDGDVRRDWRTVRAAFAAVPGVENVSTSSRVPGDWKDLTQIDVRVPGSATDLTSMSYIAIDDRFFETYRIELAAGRALSDEFGADSSAVIINEAAAKLLGVSSLDGGIIQVPGSEFEGRIVGIARDFHFRSLHEEIGPLVLGYWNNPIRVIDYFTARVSGDDLAGTIAGLQAVGQRFDPGHPFEYNILEDRLSDFYVDDQRMGTLFGLAALLAILIACIGLAGLASYTAERRTKEIGVRKVLGASVRGIVVLMSREFVALVGISFAVAVPIAYFVTDRWLEGFAFRTELSPGLFLVAGILTLVIAVATVSYQAVRSALANPVESLRYE